MKAARAIPATLALTLFMASALAADEPNPASLFVQTGAGVDVTKDGDTYTIKVSGAGPKTTVFTDRPQRSAELAPNDAVISALKPTADNPVNAALVYAEDGEDVAALVELTTGSFDPATKTLTYTAKPLPLDHAMGTATGHNKTELAATNAKDGVALLLDDCPGGKHWCTMCLNCVDTCNWACN